MEYIDSSSANRKSRAPAPYRDLSSLLRDAGAVHGDGEESEQTRARVIRALATFERSGKSRIQAERVERQFAIITRCDLGGQLHKVVAADLGVSMRTFYRERGEAFERLRLALTSERSRPALPPLPSPMAKRLEAARLLATQGRLADAVARLNDLQSAELEPALAAAVHARLAALSFRLGDVDASGEALARAKRAAALLGNGAPHAVAEAEIALVEVLQLRAAGKFGSAAAVAGRIPMALHVRPTRAVPSGAEAVRAALLAQIDLFLEQGAAAQALSIAGDAQSLLQTDDACPLDVRLDLALRIADAQLIVDGDCTSALRTATEAYATATAERLHRHAIRALRLVGLVYAILGERAVGVRYVRTAGEMLTASLTGSDARWAALELAGAAADLGDAATAQKALDSAGAGSSGDDAAAAILRLRQAEVLVLQRRFRDGVTRARDATRLLAGTDSRRYLGEATLALARALEGCDEHRAARGAAIEAAALLTGTSWPSRVTGALELAGRGDVGLRLRLERHRLPAARRLTAS